jgi:hypothetical protein
MPRVPALDLLLEQLWAPAVASGHVRVAVGPPTAHAEQGWREREAYWMFPTAGRARLLLPRGPRRVAAAAATNYRGLRRPTKNVGRSFLGAASRIGLPTATAALTVQVRESHPDAEAALPLPTLARALGVERLYASTGVRAGANRKATLHLLSDTGSPVGYAKFGWNEATDLFVRTEAAALREVGGRPGAARAPRLLAEVDYHGHPVIVTEPLPLDVRGARSASVAAPTPEEFFELCPVVRRGPAAGTEHFSQLAARLAGLADQPVAGDIARDALSIVGRLADRRDVVPVTARWHGDLTPWNRARDGEGQLWLWDWESSEPDAVAGLDAVHWAFSTRRPASGAASEVDLTGSLAEAAPALRAAGVAAERHADVGAIYALTVVERAADLARRSGGWDDVWIKPHQLRELLGQTHLLHT